MKYQKFKHLLQHLEGLYFSQPLDHSTDTWWNKSELQQLKRQQQLLRSQYQRLHLQKAYHYYRCWSRLWKMKSKLQNSLNMTDSIEWRDQRRAHIHLLKKWQCKDLNIKSCLYRSILLIHWVYRIYYYHPDSIFHSGMLC